YAGAREAWSRITPIEAAGNFDAVPKALFEKVRKTPGPLAEEAALLDEWYRLDDSPVLPKYTLMPGKPLPADGERRLARFWSWHGLNTVLKFPDSQLDLADVDMRLVLASIMEGSHDRAERELKHFAERHPESKGVLGGKRVHYVTTLTELLS